MLHSTNALYSVKLETATEPKIDFVYDEKTDSVKLPVDLSSIKVNMIEERRFNIYAHDVTGMLTVLDYSFTEGTGPDMYFCVKLGTDYKDGKYEGLEIKPLELKIKVP